MKDLVRDIRDGRLSRRDLSKIMAGFGLATVALPFTRRAAKADTDITYFTWEGYNGEEFHELFTAKYGSSPESTLFPSEDDALQKMLGGFRTTLAHPCTYAVSRWREADVIKPFDPNRLSNWPDIWEDLKRIPNTSDPDGTQWFAPFDWGNSSVVYREDMVEPGEETWAILYDERYKQKIAMTDDAEANVEVAALVLGYDNIFNLDDAQLAEVKKLMQKQRDIVRYHWTSETELQQSFAAGEIAAAYGWNSTVWQLKAEGLPMKMATPKEGIFTWVCGLVFIKDGPGDEQQAYDFVDAMLSPEAGKHLIEDWGYGHSNKKTFEIVDGTVLDNLGMLQPSDLLSSGIFFEPVPTELGSKYAQLYLEVQAGG